MCVLATCAIRFHTYALTRSSTHIFSSISTSRARFLYRSFPTYFRRGISNSQYTIIVRRKRSELRNEGIPSSETGNSHHEGDNEPASRVKEQFDRREKSFRRKSRIFERMTQVASTGRPLGKRSAHSNREGHVSPGRMGEPSTGRRGTGG